jgi:hypothetical protein
MAVERNLDPLPVDRGALHHDHGHFIYYMHLISA